MSISIKKAGEACRVVCDVMAPRDGKASFQAAVDYEQRCKAAFMMAFKSLLVAYQKDPLKS